ncbi:MAG: 1-deoxy-D-xylulose-5-phosphate synthase, partial [Elusimicrobia bacterium]|nr:1-deoxy-D-xylulose-5-phosphate synthase [Elusimicrobiota bacterium]
IGKLVEVLNAVKGIKGPVLLHVITKKGKGYAPAEEKPIAFHGLGIFDKITGEPEKKSSPGQTYTRVFSNTMLRLAQEDPRVVAITAAMPEGTGLDAFRDRFPGRYYDVGIAEEHAATFAAGLACEGLRPVVAMYSSFSQRCYDQILHDICLQKLPVVFALDRAGIVGEDGPTHHGVFDLSFLRGIPGLAIMAPSDENELQHALKTALSLAVPCVLRYPRGSGPGAAMDKEPAILPFGKGVWRRKGRDLTILAAGNRVQPALEAARLLEKQSIDCGVADLRFIKPLDVELLREALETSRDIVTIEDNALPGGMGSAVLEQLNEQPLPFRLLRLGVPDMFVKHGKPEQLYEELGLTARKICETIAWRFSRAAKAQQGDIT